MEMTRAWLNFERVRHGNAQDKREGYCGDDFPLMTASERDEARQWLLNESMAGSALELAALKFVLPTSELLPVLRAVMADSRLTLWGRASAAAALVDADPDLAQEAIPLLLSALHSPHLSLKAQAMEGLTRVQDRSSAAQLLELADTAAHEPNETDAYRLIRLLLNGAAGIPFAPQQRTPYGAVAAALSEIADPALRKAGILDALQQVGRQGAGAPPAA